MSENFSVAMVGHFRLIEYAFKLEQLPIGIPYPFCAIFPCQYRTAPTWKDRCFVRGIIAGLICYGVCHIRILPTSIERFCLLQIEIPNDDSRPDRIHVIAGFLRTLGALGARQQVLFERRKFGFVFHDAKVEALQIVIADVLHASLVFGIAEKSHKCFSRAAVDGTGERNRGVPGSASSHR